MTLTFKDSDGREWELRAHRVDYGDSRFAEPADLLAALGQLSTGSDGPTDAKRLRELAAVGFFDTLQADISTPLDDAEVDGLRTVWNDGHWHGRCLGEQKQAARVRELESLAYLGDHHFPDLTYKSRCDELQSELAATKTKLAEVERERDHAHDSAEELLTEDEKLRSELASARRVVEAADAVIVEWLALRVTDKALTALASALDERDKALASAGTDAGRSTAGTDLALQGLSMLREAELGAWARARLSSELKTLLVATWELVAAVTQNKGDWIAEARTKAETAARAGDALLDEVATAEKAIRKGTDADRTEAPRDEAGESGPVCTMHGCQLVQGGGRDGLGWRCMACRAQMPPKSTEEPKPAPPCEHRCQVLRDERGRYFCTNCQETLTGEPKPEPQPSGELRRGPASGKVEP